MQALALFDGVFMALINFFSLMVQFDNLGDSLDLEEEPIYTPKYFLNY